MSESYAKTSKFGKILAKLRLSMSKSFTESTPLNEFKCPDRDDFGYLIERRQWTQRYTSEVQTGHGGASSDKKSDLEISGLLYLQEPDLSDEVEEVSYDTPFEISCFDSSCYDLETEGNQNSDDSEQGEMESNQSRSKKNVATNHFRLGSFKKYPESNDSTYTSKDQKSLKEESQTTHVKICYAPLTQPGPSQDSYYVTPKASAASIDIPPDQSLLAKQHSVLRRLHFTLNEATNIVGEFLLLNKRDE